MHVLQLLHAPAAPSAAPASNAARTERFADHLQRRREDAAPAPATPRAAEARAAEHGAGEAASDRRADTSAPGRPAGDEPAHATKPPSPAATKPQHASGATAGHAAATGSPRTGATDATDDAADLADAARATGDLPARLPAPPPSDEASPAAADAPAPAPGDASAAVPAALPVDWLAQFARPAPATPRDAVPASPAARAAIAEAGPRGIGATQADEHALGAALAHAAPPAAPPHPDPAAAAPFAALVAEQHGATGAWPTADAAHDPALPAALGALAGASAPHSALASAPTPPTLALPAPPDTPAFAPALATTVAVLARDGVQEARLALHPAELGPIAVRIALDGTDARVDFHAQVAATRHAIEAALPELAGALRENGLTLTGGGVFEQPRERHEGTPQAGAEARGTRAGDAEPATRAAPLALRRVRAGGVDEYA